MSFIVIISKPVLWTARIAVSRPEPWPLINTSTFFKPKLKALLQAASDAV